MVACEGAGDSHDLIARLDKLAVRSGYQVIYAVGWELGELGAGCEPGACLADHSR